MGRGPHPQLERRRLDRPVAPHRRQDRGADRRAAGRGQRRRLDLAQPVQVAQRRGRAAACRRAGAPRDPLRARQLPDRSLHGRKRRRVARPRPAAGRWRADRRRAERRRRGADADARQLPQRPHAPARRDDARGACGRRPRRLGPGAFGRRRAGRPARRRRRFRRRLRLQVPERRTGRAGVRVGAPAPHRAHGPRAICASRSRAGSATRRRSISRRRTGRRAASPASSAARRRCWR